VRPAGDGFACDGCGLDYPRDAGGLCRFLSPQRTAAAGPFLQQYRAVRARHGYRSDVPDYYRMLPCVGPGDPRADEWRVRRDSFAHLQRYVLGANGHQAKRVLDLGAGSGWMSHRLAELGHRVVAVDRFDDEADGLGACRHYPVAFATVQADFDALPFEPAQFDLAVFNGSLHYSPDPAATLAEAARMLAAGGVIVVMDSPMFSRERHGAAMLADERTRIKDETGVDITRPGVGFFTFAALDAASRTLGLRGRFVPSRGSLEWRVRRQLAWLRLRRAPSAFGVWIAQ
jgi:SAM-dependent methyltransferase